MFQCMRRIEWLAVVICIILAGCHGGHGPTLPGPDGGGPADRVISGAVQVDHFTVAEAERVACEGDVVVECSTATIEGALFARPTIIAGGDGSSITIQATGDVVVSGTVAAGSGVQGGTDADGGSGGDITITSTDGDVTIGAAGAVASVRPSQADRAIIQAGSGAGGGHGYYGGAGGEGGTITIFADKGKLNIHERPNLFGIGNGGAGGQAAIFGDDMLTREPADEPTNSGGDSGQLLLAGQDVEGVPFENTDETIEGRPIRLIRLEGDTVIGGAGGDGGDSYWGVDPRSGETAGPSMLRTLGGKLRSPVRTSQAHETWFGGAGDGGAGVFESGDGGAKISDARGQAPVPDPWHKTGRAAYGGAAGGDGGDIFFVRIPDKDIALFAQKQIVVGNGGDATAFGGRGPDGGYAQNGGDGGDAHARGGDGGGVSLQPFWYSDDLITFGRGGNAVAEGGIGGDGGAACNPPPQPGGNGGKGGSARAEGGHGSRRGTGRQDKDAGDIVGVGGNAQARGGRGGDGGQGRGGGTRGAGGEATGVPGEGNPGGWATERTGEPGAHGRVCPVQDRTTSYSVIVRPSMSCGLDVHSNFHSVTTQQLEPDRTILAVPANEGQSMYMTADQSVLWVAAVGRVGHVSNPTTAGASLDFWMTPDGGPEGRHMYSVWLDEQRDLLYASREDGLHVWENASALTKNTAASYTITITDWRLWSITGDAQNDRLFAVGFNPNLFRRVLVFDNISGLRDTIVPDREMLGITGSEALAYDPSRDLLYTSDEVNLKRVANASQAQGNVAFVAVEGPATGFERPATAMQIFPDTNVLFVQEYGGPLHVYENASSLAGNVPPNLSRNVGTARWPVSMIAWGVEQ